MRRISAASIILLALFVLVACRTDEAVKASGFVQGKYAYVARDRQMQVVEIDRPDRPRWVATVDIPGRIVKIVVEGRYAYVVHYPSGESWVGDPVDGGVLIVDVGRSKLPKPVGLYHTPSLAQDVAVLGDIAYVADWDGLRVVNVSDPANPVEISSVPQGMSAVTVHDSHLYGTWGNCSFRSGYCVGGLWVADISVPSRPVELDSITPEDVPGYSVAIRENQAYIAGNGLWQVDLSDKSDLRLGKELQLFEGRYQARVTVAEEYAFLVTDKGMRVIDVSSPDEMTVQTFLPMTAFVGDIALRDDYVYLTNNEGLHIIDIHQPDEPVVVGYYSGVR